jgi:hypothetical protein
MVLLAHTASHAEDVVHSVDEAGAEDVVDGDVAVEITTQRGEMEKR